MEFQEDNHLEYRCATCRGECYQVQIWTQLQNLGNHIIVNLMGF